MRSLAQQFVLAVSLAASLVALASGHEFDTTSAWLPEVEQLYRPDVHYSRAAAVNALARTLAETLKDDDDAVVQARCADDGLCGEVERTIREAGLELGSGGISLVAHVSTGENLDQAVTFHVAGRDFEMTAPFVTKPWISNRPQGGFQVVRGLAAGDIVGKSRDVMAQAIESKILPRVRKMVGEKYFPNSRWAMGIAGNRVKELLQDSPIIVDRFRQTFYTTMDGEQHVALVREAVLLDLSDEKMEGIVQPIVRDLHRARRRWSVAIGFATVAVTSVLFVCCVGYSFFNRITQGYYIWTVRFATAAILAVSVMLAVKIAVSMLNST